MDSKIAREKYQGLIENCKRMTATERVHAFIAHSKNMAEVYNAGVAERAKSTTEDSK